MTKYIIEDNLNFYEELKKSFHNENLDNTTDVVNLSEDQSKLSNPLPMNREKFCLITNEPLKENAVTLDCNHTFNYIPIFNDIFNHKKIFNSMERMILKANQIRCPYCRHVQNRLLPYVEKEGVDLVNGVNYLDEKYMNRTYITHYKSECTYLLESNIKCKNNSVKLFNIDGKCYCKSHYNMKYKEYTKKIKAEEKMKIKMAKKVAKEESKAKAETKIDLGENIIISHDSNVLQVTGCIAIIKSGKNQGKNCQCKVFFNQVCKRHYNFYCKKVLEEKKE